MWGAVRNPVKRRKLDRVIGFGNCSFRNSAPGVMLKAMKPLKRVDTHNPSAERHDVLYRPRRSEIREMVVAHGILCVLTRSGCCIAYECDSMTQLCYVNVVPNEVIRSIYHNRKQDALITVSTHKIDNFRSLRCRSVPFDSLLRKQPSRSTEMFSDEPLSYPSFVEFDQRNDLIITWSHPTNTYKFWDMESYTQKTEIYDSSIKELRCAEGTVLLLLAKPSKKKENSPPVLPSPNINYHKAFHDGVMVEIRNVITGERLLKLDLCDKYVPWDMLEHYNHKFLYKPKGGGLSVFDLVTHEITVISAKDFPKPTSYLFLNGMQAITVFHDDRTELWDLKGVRQACVKGKIDATCVQVCDALNMLVGLMEDTDASSDGKQTNVSKVVFLSLRDGKIVAELAVDNPSLNGTELDSWKRSRLQALTDAVSLCYDEHNQQLYTGDKDGIVTCWGKK